MQERLDAVRGYLAAVEREGFYFDPARCKADPVDLEALFGEKPVELEIGCGKGGFIDRLSGLHPDVGYLAVERVSNVIVCAAETARERGRENLRFLNVSAENLLYYLPSHKIRAIYLNFSCPYPKKTYANHRLTHPKFLKIYRELLTEDGVIAQKTDNAAFFAYSLRSYSENGFEIMMQTDYIVRDGWENLPTEYENKFVAEGKNIYGAKISLKILKKFC